MNFYPYLYAPLHSFETACSGIITEQIHNADYIMSYLCSES